jgi:hypothetical protein
MSTARDVPKKHSRVLAALGENPGLVDVQVPQSSQIPNALKRKFQATTPNYESPAESSTKKKAGSSQRGSPMNYAEVGGQFVC